MSDPYEGSVRVVANLVAKWVDDARQIDVLTIHQVSIMRQIRGVLSPALLQQLGPERVQGFVIDGLNVRALWDECHEAITKKPISTRTTRQKELCRRNGIRANLLRRVHQWVSSFYQAYTNPEPEYESEDDESEPPSSQPSVTSVHLPSGRLISGRSAENPSCGVYVSTSTSSTIGPVDLPARRTPRSEISSSLATSSTSASSAGRVRSSQLSSTHSSEMRAPTSSGTWSSMTDFVHGAAEKRPRPTTGGDEDDPFFLAEQPPAQRQRLVDGQEGVVDPDVVWLSLNDFLSVYDEKPLGPTSIIVVEALLLQCCDILFGLTEDSDVPADLDREWAVEVFHDNGYDIRRIRGLFYQPDLMPNDIVPLMDKTPAGLHVPFPYARLPPEAARVRLTRPSATAPRQGEGSSAGQTQPSAASSQVMVPTGSPVDTPSFIGGAETKGNDDEAE